MRRISIIALILCGCFVSATWGQQQTGIPRTGKSGILRHRPVHAIPNFTGSRSNPNISKPAALAKTVKFYDLGKYPGGTYAQVYEINGWGVAVGLGDTPAGYDPNLDPPRGYTRPIGISLFGPQAMQWFDLGTFGGESYQNSFETADTAAMGITDTGMIVGLAPRTDNYVRAFAWTARSGRTDLGALENLDYFYSNALGVNKLGTLIVGWSGGSDGFSLPALPVAWTPSLKQKQGRPAISWKIHQLDTKGFEQYPYWVAVSANDFAQVVGFGWDDSGAQIAVLWSPLPDGKDWKAIQLPGSSDYPDYIYAYAGDVNEKGEIVGEIYNADFSVGLPTLWRPVDRQRHTYKLTVLRTLSGLQQGYADIEGMNDLGDIVGTTSDPPDYNPVATLWSTRDRTFVQALDFQGYFGVAYKVNEFRFVTGGYWSDNCPNSCAAVVQLR